MANSIIIKLTKKQQLLIEPLIYLLGEMGEKGKHGMALAQVFKDHMNVGYISNEKAKQIQNVMGCIGTTRGKMNTNTPNEAKA